MAKKTDLTDLTELTHPTTHAEVQRMGASATPDEIWTLHKAARKTNDTGFAEAIIRVLDRIPAEKFTLHPQMPQLSYMLASIARQHPSTAEKCINIMINRADRDSAQMIFDETREHLNDPEIVELAIKGIDAITRKVGPATNPRKTDVVKTPIEYIVELATRSPAHIDLALTKLEERAKAISSAQPAEIRVNPRDTADVHTENTASAFNNLSVVSPAHAAKALIALANVHTHQVSLSASSEASKDSLVKAATEIRDRMLSDEFVKGLIDRAIKPEDGHLDRNTLRVAATELARAFTAADGAFGNNFGERAALTAVIEKVKKDPRVPPQMELRY